MTSIGGFTAVVVVLRCCATVDDKRCDGAKQERRVVDQKGSKAIPSLLAPTPFLPNAQRLDPHTSSTGEHCTEREISPGERARLE